MERPRMALTTFNVYLYITLLASFMGFTSAAECSAIPLGARRECGYPGILQLVCVVGRLCCFDTSVPNTITCFLKESIAMEKPAYQAGTFAGHEAHKAVDGYVTRGYKYGGCAVPDSSMATSVPAWWYVKLSNGTDIGYVISDVTLYIDLTCQLCLGTTFPLTIGTGFTSDISTHRPCATIGNMSSVDVVTVPCRPPTPVSYLSVVHNYSNFMVLCEVIVEGYKYMACPQGFHGEGCTAPCPAECRYSCDDITAACRRNQEDDKSASFSMTTLDPEVEAAKAGEKEFPVWMVIGLVIGVLVVVIVIALVTAFVIIKIRKSRTPKQQDRGEAPTQTNIALEEDNQTYHVYEEIEEGNYPGDLHGAVGEYLHPIGANEEVREATVVGDRPTTGHYEKLNRTPDNYQKLMFNGSTE